MLTYVPGELFYDSFKGWIVWPHGPLLVEYFLFFSLCSPTLQIIALGKKSQVFFQMAGTWGSSQTKKGQMHTQLTQKQVAWCVRQRDQLSIPRLLEDSHMQSESVQSLWLYSFHRKQKKKQKQNKKLAPCAFQRSSREGAKTASKSSSVSQLMLNWTEPDPVSDWPC